MAVELNSIVPWGRSFDEYVAMFALSEADLSGKILGCGDGPASFNAEADARGHHVLSVDPTYAFNPEQLRQRFEEVRDEVLEQTEKNRDLFVWHNFANVDELGAARSAAMDRFLKHFDASRERYLTGSLPELPFSDGAFDLCVVSHLLFLYSGHLDLTFHVRSVRELMRVANGVRIFPLQQLDATRSVHLDPLKEQLASEFRFEEIPVDYEFQRGANHMLVIRKIT